MGKLASHKRGLEPPSPKDESRVIPSSPAPAPQLHLALHEYAKPHTVPSAEGSSRAEACESHSYARKTVSEQVTSVRRSLALSSQTDPNSISALKQRLETCHSVDDAASIILSMPTVKECIETRLLHAIDSSIQLLLGEGPTASILGMPLKDERVSCILELAITEMNKRIP